MVNEDSAALAQRKLDDADLSSIWCRLAISVPNRYQVDAIYHHGLSDGMNDSSHIFKAIQLAMRNSKARFLAYNGSDGRGAAPDSKPKSGWGGEQAYRETYRALGMKEHWLHPTRPGLHTRDETDAFIELAAEKDWTSALVATVPYHQPRSLSCFVGSMEKVGHFVKIWFLPPGGPVDWNCPMVGSQGTESDSTFLKESAGDVERLFAYWAKGRENGGTAWKTAFGAPAPEMHEYFNKRDG